MRYHLLPEQRSSLSTQRTTTRKPDGMKPYVFAIGKNSLKSIICRFYNVVIQIWMWYNILRNVKTYVILGGGSLFAIHNESEVYNPRTDRWAPIPSMGIRRSRAGVASLGKVLYVIGG